MVKTSLMPPAVRMFPFAVLIMVAVVCIIGAERSQAAGTFVPTPELSHGASDPITATLPDGRIVTAGGNGSHLGKGGTYPVKGADVFDPVTGRFSVRGRLSVARVGGSAIPLSDGNVLFVGGEYASIFTTAEVFDTNTGRSTILELPPQIPKGARPYPLKDGKVLFIGAIKQPIPQPYGYMKSASILDPATGAVTTIGDFPVQPSVSHELELPDGRLLFIEGSSSEEDGHTIIFDPATNSFALGGPNRPTRAGASYVVLEDGRILIAGGYNVDGGGNFRRFVRRAEIFDPASGTTSWTGSLSKGRTRSATVKLSDGRVLVAGGIGSRYRSLRSAEIYDPTTGNFQPTGDLLRPQSNSALVALPDGRALLTGGVAWAGDWCLARPSTAIFDPDGETATVKRITVAPKIRTVRIGKRFSFNVRIRNSGEGTARRVKVCTNAVFPERLRCPLLKAIPSKETRVATVKLKLFKPKYSRNFTNHPAVPGTTRRMRIYAVGQDVEVHSIVAIRVR